MASLQELIKEQKFYSKVMQKFTEWITKKCPLESQSSLGVLKIYEILAQSIDFVNKIKYNEYTNIDKLIYQIN